LFLSIFHETERERERKRRKYLAKHGDLGDRIHLLDDGLHEVAAEDLVARLRIHARQRSDRQNDLTPQSTE
jgi:hypothetical protein